VYEQTAGEPEHTYTDTSEPRRANVTLHCLADDYDTAESLYQKVRDAIDLAGGTWGTVTVDKAFVKARTSRRSPPTTAPTRSSTRKPSTS
jgi:hypothetical protein